MKACGSSHPAAGKASEDLAPGRCMSRKHSTRGKSPPGYFDGLRDCPAPPPDSESMDQTQEGPTNGRKTAFEAPPAAHRQCSALLNRLACSRSGRRALRPDRPHGQAASRRDGQRPVGQAACLLRCFGKPRRLAQDRANRVIEHGERHVEPVLHGGKPLRG